MSSEEDEKKELYEFDGSYLKKLNQIRKQFNLIAISDDEKEEQSNQRKSHPNQTGRDVHSKKKKENRNKISAERRSSSEGTSCEIKVIFDDHSDKKIQNSSEERDQNLTRESEDKKWEKAKTDEIEMETIYTPPKKKMCFRDSYESIYSSDESKSDDRSVEKQWESDNSKKNYSEIKSDSGSIRSDESTDARPSQWSLGVGKLPHVERDEKFEESEPSEQSSPVKQSPRKSLQVPQLRKTKPAEEHPFFSLNVPLTHKGKSLFVPPKVTVLYEDQKSFIPEMISEESEDLSKEDVKASNERYDKKMLMTGLDLPKKSKEFYNFPSFVHIAKWGTPINEEEKDKIFSEKTAPTAEGNFQVPAVERDKLDMFPDLMNLTPGTQLTEVETISSLNDMYRIKQQEPTVEPVAESSSNSSRQHRTRRDCVRDFCQCCTFCFVRKRRNFFS